MQAENQKQVWDKIAHEWSLFKTEPSEQVLKFLKKQEGNILDLGSGSGRHLTRIKNGKMYLVDFSKEMIKIAREKAEKNNIPAEFSISELTKLPYKDNFFDAAIAISSIHCIDSVEKRETAVKELYRVLKQGNVVFIGVWNKETKKFKNSPKERYVKWTDKGLRYYYLFDEQEIHNLFKTNGFKILKTMNSGTMINFITKKEEEKTTNISDRIKQKRITKHPQILKTDKKRNIKLKKTAPNISGLEAIKKYTNISL
ncbi:MAG TPA: class I SAM-dependent methyltransferase [Candidatus Nanoarchaeia archaeon]|nr:class I SAM-dependent methyltransferase [Candidatus Nanoarchaeia archaeon]